MRIGFVTDELASDLGDAGGLGAYVQRTAAALGQLGHEVEILARSFDAQGVSREGGVRVERVRPFAHGLTGLRERLARAPWPPLPRETRKRVRTAWALGRAFARRDAERPFDWVQSASCSLCGLFVRPRRGRHLLRLSALHALWREADGLPLRGDDLATAWLERRAARRADLVYAPSRFLAARAGDAFGIDVATLRPAFALGAKPAPAPPAALPERFLLHFGTLGRRKGSETLAAALPLAWQREPALELVFAGREAAPGRFLQWRSAWGSAAERVRYLGALERPALYAVIERASASVLPSLVDNLPNTVMESLALGTPVVGTRGASIDEQVEDGVSGALVPEGDAAALADALVAAWRGDAAWARGFGAPFWLTPEGSAEALQSLLRAGAGSPA